EQLAEPQAGHAGRDAAERSANLGGRVWFRVPGVDVARPAGHPVQDDGRVLAGGMAFAGREECGQREPAETEGAHAAEAAACDAVAERTGGGAEDGEHRRVLRGDSSLPRRYREIKAAIRLGCKCV